MPPPKQVTAYFAYGSNLDESQMLRRCSWFRVVSTGVLRHHQLVFAGWSALWDGPVATVIPKRGAEVPGVVYEVTKEGLAALDRCEGHPRFYGRKMACIHALRGHRRRAAVYYLNIVARPAPPGWRYFSTILTAYREWGLDDAPLLRAALDVDGRESRRVVTGRGKAQLALALPVARSCPLSHSVKQRSIF